MLLLYDPSGPFCFDVLQETPQVLVRPSSFGPRPNVWLYGTILVRGDLILKELGKGKRNEWNDRAEVVGKEDPP